VKQSNRLLGLRPELLLIAGGCFGVAGVLQGFIQLVLIVAGLGIALVWLSGRLSANRYLKQRIRRWRRTDDPAASPDNSD